MVRNGASTVGIKPHPGLKNAWQTMRLFVCKRICVMGMLSDGRRGCRFITSGLFPGHINRRSLCPVPLKLSLLSASLHSYPLVQLSKKSQHHTLLQLLQSQYLTKCNTVRGQICSAPDTPKIASAPLPQAMISDNIPHVIARIRDFCYATGTQIINSWSKLCIILKLQVACVLQWSSRWGHVRSRQNLSASRQNLSTINSVKFRVVPTAARHSTVETLGLHRAMTVGSITPAIYLLKKSVSTIQGLMFCASLGGQAISRMTRGMTTCHQPGPQTNNHTLTATGNCGGALSATFNMRGELSC